MTAMQTLLRRVRACTECAAQLPQAPRPILSAHEAARILVIGQAPGATAHERGTPWDDASGDRLREWMGVDRARFYDPRWIALMPMGFCYPGRGASGDRPPRKECAPLWHEALRARMPNVALTLLIGQYAQAYYLSDGGRGSLTETVRAWRDFAPGVLPLPHPSPRNNLWLSRHPWFARDLLPYLRKRVRRLTA